MKLKDVLNYGSQSKGQSELIKHLHGEVLTRTQAMSAKCYECCNGYIDGRTDCRVSSCPIYGFMPYNPNKTLPTRNFSEETKKALRKRAKKRFEQV